MSIYLDNSATTKIRKEALDKYIEVSEGAFGNPSSLHAMGYEAEKLLTEARRTLLSSLGKRDGQVIFTASGSEANNLAIFGRAYAKERYKNGRKKIITTEGEHASVSEPLVELERAGFNIVRVPTLGGAVDLDFLNDALDENVILLSMMMVNNETGALYDIKKISDTVKKKCHEALIHIDATQSYMKLPFSCTALGIDMITVSSHKIEGPKGVGALVIDEKIIKERGLRPITLGGGQEAGLRSGTENTPAIAAFGEAIKYARLELEERFRHISALREMLISRLEGTASLAEISITKPESHAPHILNITLPDIKSETMLHFLSARGIYVSSGSACSSNGTHVSSALLAYGRSAAEADCSIRISLSARNTESDIEAFSDALSEGLRTLARVRK